MIDIIEDLSKLTTIPRDRLDKLTNKISFIIGDGLCEKSDTNIYEFDIGIGTLEIIDEECIRYRFKPSKDFEKLVFESLVNNKNILQDTFEKTLAQKIMKVYKDII